MELIKLTEANFEAEVLKSEKPVLVDFYADWCGPCKMLSPIVDEIAEENADKIKVCKLNIDDVASIAAKYSVMSIPTLIFFENGKDSKKLVGMRPKDAICHEFGIE